ncbi:hypothetical protein WDW89_02525 [Deltaproteobacteria bacterium TL4]
MKKWNYRRIIIFGFFMMIPFSIYSYTDNTHQNFSEDALIFMETEGSNQMRWVADYYKAKAGGRYTGVCENKSDETNPLESANAGPECGAIGIARVGGVKPDYFRDVFWDDFTIFHWNIPNPFYRNNFTSWSHFINLLQKADEGHDIVTNNYNDYDGYSYNNSFGFPSMGLDYAVASGMNNAWMTIDLPHCTHSRCAERYSIVPNPNPAVDYKQNRATTSLGTPQTEKKSGGGNGTNYNCFSDSSLGNCPDSGYSKTCKSANCGWFSCSGPKSGGPFQIPGDNIHCGKGKSCSDSDGECGPGQGNPSVSDEDWVIYEPADNAGTFFYNEFFLEGGTSRNTQLDIAAVAGRYYSIQGNELIHVFAPLHWAADSGVQPHIWATLGYNHSETETWIDEQYGKRKVGGNDVSKNYENYDHVKAYLASRQNHYEGIELDDLFMEQAFLTYHLRLRNGHDTQSNSDDASNRNYYIWAVPNVITTEALIIEKGVMDLRKYKGN